MEGTSADASFAVPVSSSSSSAPVNTNQSEQSSGETTVDSTVDMASNSSTDQEKPVTSSTHVEESSSSTANLNTDEARTETIIDTEMIRNPTVSEADCGQSVSDSPAVTSADDCTGLGTPALVSHSYQETVAACTASGTNVLQDCSSATTGMGDADATISSTQASGQPEMASQDMVTPQLPVADTTVSQAPAASSGDGSEHSVSDIQHTPVSDSTVSDFPVPDQQVPLPDCHDYDVGPANLPGDDISSTEDFPPSHKVLENNTHQTSVTQSSVTMVTEPVDSTSSVAMETDSLSMETDTYTADSSGSRSDITCVTGVPEQCTDVEMVDASDISDLYGHGQSSTLEAEKCMSSTSQSGLVEVDTPVLEDSEPLLSNDHKQCTEKSMQVTSSSDTSTFTVPPKSIVDASQSNLTENVESILVTSGVKGLVAEKGNSGCDATDVTGSTEHGTFSPEIAENEMEGLDIHVSHASKSHHKGDPNTSVGSSNECYNIPTDAVGEDATLETGDDIGTAETDKESIAEQAESVHVTHPDIHVSSVNVHDTPEDSMDKASMFSSTAEKLAIFEGSVDAPDTSLDSIDKPGAITPATDTPNPDTLEHVEGSITVSDTLADAADKPDIFDGPDDCQEGLTSHADQPDTNGMDVDTSVPDFCEPGTPSTACDSLDQSAVCEPTPAKRSRHGSNASSAQEVEVESAVYQHPVFTADNLFEYQWPQNSSGEYYMLQEQISEYLLVKSFKRKYPELQRRVCDKTEKDFLRERGVVTETQSDLGLTALRSEEVCDLMHRDYPSKYQEYAAVLHEKERRSINEKHKEYGVPKFEKSKMVEYLKKAMKSASEWNGQFLREKREERRAYFDLQTFAVHFPEGRYKKLPPEATKVSPYPVTLIPGQFQDHYKSYTADGLKYFPLNTAIYNPPMRMKSTTAGKTSEKDSDEDGEEDGDQATAGSGSGADSDEDSSSDSDDSSSQAESEQRKSSKDTKDLPPEEKKCRICQQPAGKTVCAKEEEDLVECSECGSCGHPTCLDMTSDIVAVIKTYPWQCMECKTCVECMDPYDEDKMMFCDHCDRGYHTFCVGLKSIPTGCWKCVSCRDTETPVKDTPTKTKGTPGRSAKKKVKTKEVRETKESKEPKETKEPKEQKEPKELKEPKKSKESKESKDSKDPKESKSETPKTKSRSRRGRH